MSSQELLIEFGALALLCSSVVLVRKRMLSLRYGLGWLTVAVAGLAGGPLLELGSREVKSLGFTETGFSLGVFIMFLGLLCLQLSISLSGLHHAVQDLSEHAALLDERVRQLEAGGGSREEARSAASELGSGW